jgi:formylglycine-generating enzyme required for sulfatase activity
LGGIVYLAASGQGKKDVHATGMVTTPEKTSASASASIAAPPPPPPKNRWVRIDPPPRGPRVEPVYLGISKDTRDENIAGFRPALKIEAPAEPFEIHQHEVTWEEFDEWLAANPAQTFERPKQVPAEPDKRAKLPASGVSWDLARGFCKSVGGTLPSEEQWEYAARGPTRRAFAWGNQPIDLVRTHAFRGEKAVPTEVMSSDQDVTPGDEAHAINDLMGNVREWMADLYRSDNPGEDMAWVQEGGMTYRTVRGLPLEEPAKAIPAEGAAYRGALCATGPCPDDAKAALQWIGFRCVRAARVQEGRR